MGRVSIHQVARKAKCSIATVSNVLNSKGRVGEEQRAAVLKAVKQLGYIRDATGRSLRTGRTETVGLMFYPSCAGLFRNPFYAEVMEALEEEFTKNRYNLLLAGYEISKAYSEFSSEFLRGRVDAVALVGGFPTEIIEELFESQKNLVLIDTDADHLSLDSVVSDGGLSSKLVVSHLVELGHKRIHMAAYRMEDYNTDTRVRSFIQMLKQNNLPTEKAVNRERLYSEEIAADLFQLLSGPNPPTAVYAVNDTLALDLINSLQAAGVKVPEDVSIVGFDDDEFCLKSKPTLTTVRVNRKQLGVTGAELLFRRINNSTAPVSKMRLPVELVARDSTASPNKRIKRK